jgi:signal transduction histidine kinase
VRGASCALVTIAYREGRSKKRRAIDLEQLVHERTIELKRLVESLERSQAERSFLLDGMSKRINACLATMKGLGRIALTYEDVPPELVKNIDVTTDILADLLQQIALEKKL